MPRRGIIIPDTAKEKPQEGKVIAVGNGKVNEDGKDPLDGGHDRILFGKLLSSGEGRRPGVPDREGRGRVLAIINNRAGPRRH